MIIAVSLLGLLEEESLDNVLHTVKRYGIEYVELPLTYILKKKWQDIEVKEVEDLRFKIHRSGLKVNSLQSITYGLDFDICKLNKDDYLYLSKHFDQVAVYASMLGAKHVVYGSPSTRTGDNTRYESNFIYKFIKESNIDNIYSHFDTGNEYIESGSMPNADYVKSIHISNNKYANFMKNESYIKYINECLKNIDGIESITMENINMDEDYELLINRFKCIVLDI